MKKVLITGGGGFLGLSIIQLLLNKDISILSLQRSDCPRLRKLGVETIRGDLRDQTTVINAAKDCDTIFHVAAKVGIWGDSEEYYQCNVTGTKNIIIACQTHNIQKLIYTSSPSVVFTGDDEENINESTPYPDHFLTAYQKTKALAEKMILKANNKSLATVALRPHLIWGPGDPHLVPRIIERAKTGRLYLVGKQNNLIDSTYIDNAALAHVLVSEALTPDCACSGKAYFISNGEPLPIAVLINKILTTAQLPSITKIIPTQLAYALGIILEFIYKNFKLKGEPMMTRFVAKQFSCAHWYDLTAAKNDFSYRAKVSINQGMEILKESLEK